MSLEHRNKIDWEQVRQRMADAEAALQRAFEPGPEAREAVLLRRASELARLPDDRPGQGGEGGHLLRLRVGGQIVGLEASEVQEIISYSHWAPVPDAHEALLGLVSVRNELVNLFSPFPYLKQPGAGDTTGFAQGALLRHPHLRIALGCHEVLGFIQLRPDQLKEDGVFEHEGRLGVLLDVADVLEPVAALSQV